MIICGIFILCVILVIMGGNPLTKINAFGHSDKPVARPPTSMGLAPKVGARAVDGGVPPIDTVKAPETICITNQFTHHGIEYVMMVNGTVQPRETGVNYEICN